MKHTQRRTARMQGQASVDQVEQRERRRAQLPVQYTGEFDLLAEVHDILAPLADQVAAEQSPLTYRSYVDKLTGAVQKIAVTAADLVATADARRAAAHLPIEQRGRAVKMLRDLAVRPVAPTITDTEIASGAWANTLTSHCSTYCGALSDLLSRSAPADTRRGAPTVSETLVEALRVIDHASVDAQRQLDRAAFLRHELGPRSDTSGGTASVQSELAALGIPTCAIAADSPPGVCPDCGGPSFHYKGDVHAWRCTSCVDADIGLDRSPPPPATVPLAPDRPIPPRGRGQRGGRAVRERLTRKEFSA